MLVTKKSKLEEDILCADSFIFKYCLIVPYLD